jgi:hypothetical protein
MNVRVVARWDDDPLVSPITLDARLGAKRVAGAAPIFGATGLGAEECRPFVLDAEGVMDFGAGRPAADRFWRTDFRERDIAVGGTFEVRWSGGETGVYTIEKVAVLGSKGGTKVQSAP